MESQKLPPGISEQLGHYIYLYLDPDTDQVFYVGKGIGNRCYAHLYDGRDCEKTRTIRKIRARGKEPRIEILIHGLPDDDTAFRVECAVIDLIGVHKLTNQQRGQHSSAYGRMPLDELIAYYQQPEVKIDEPAVLIRINKLYHYGISALELYEVTRGVWVMGERRNSAQYAFAVFDGLVREVYEIEHWYPGGMTVYTTRPREDVDRPDRWEFTGRVAEPDIRDKYLLKSVRSYIKPNSQNPITYVNC